ncbi:MAG: glutaminase [Firmicutes bacterium]|nr:glutaminase [Bacillota bacterium]
MTSPERFPRQLRSLPSSTSAVAVDLLPNTSKPLQRCSDSTRGFPWTKNSCGMYDGSGRFAVEVGFPTKSGVGGGLLSVVDKEMGIGIYGPSLYSKGNCIAGNVMLKYLSQTFNMHLFHS